MAEIERGPVITTSTSRGLEELEINETAVAQINTEHEPAKGALHFDLSKPIPSVCFASRRHSIFHRQLLANLNS